MVDGSPAPYRPRVGRPTRRLPWGATQLWSIPATAGGPRHDAGAYPSRLPTGRESPVGGKPHEEYGVLNAGLAPEVHDRELARAQEPAKGLRADAKPPAGFGEWDELGRCGDLQG
jgi:hypothetical protein